MDLTLVCSLLIAHFWGDFFLQTDAMAKGKSTSNKALLRHVAVYSATVALFVVATILWLGAINPTPIALYVILNATLHFGTDYVTSRINSQLWKSGNVHNFFVGIGADQLIHYLTLILTAHFILGPIL